MKVTVKICGITNYKDAVLAVEQGADIIGFIFAESPRKVEPAKVKRIIDRLNEDHLLENVKTVGVFVNEKAKNIKNIIDKTGIDFAQIHGDEKIIETEQYDFDWYKVLRVKTIDEFEKQYFSNGLKWNCKMMLIDASVKGLYGGTGQTIPYEVAKYAKEKINNDNKFFFLAGGINCENIKEILNIIKPDGIDISSGVELFPGTKSEDKMKKIFRIIKDYDEVQNG